MATETLIAEQWIYATLKADSTLTALIGGSSNPRIYADVAPGSAAFPYVVMQLQGSGDDLLGVGTTRIFSDLVYVVKAVTEGTSYAGNLATLATRIDAVLHGKRGTPVGGVVVGALREAPFRLAELTNGINYRHLGGRYRLYVQDT